MGRGINGAILKLLRAEDLPCTVTKTWMHSPTMKALRISSPEFLRTYTPAEGEYLRCWFPDPDHPAKEVMRGYTMIDIDPKAGEFTLLFLLHQPAGPASRWAETAVAGDRFEASYYGSSPFSLPPNKPEGFIFVADAAGIPYVNALADQLADSFPLKVWLLDWQPSHHQIPLRHHQNITIEWIQPSAETLLEKAQSTDWKGWYPHLVCEAKVLLPTRRYLLKEAKIPKDFMYVHAYWVQGKEMGKSRELSDS
ncbi:siderophore-interacting protein [Rothia sp. P5766]|uniref:siderophore-interacting protein n=1 Tax=unclassified Rothia (in: high G+C Gram-positive bacteria) TaxID=2689056 RepID=UPI003AC345C0